MSIPLVYIPVYNYHIYLVYLKSMNGSSGSLIDIKPKSGERLTDAKKLTVISKLAEYLSEGYYSTYYLSKMTGLSQKMINKYRPVADELIGKQKIDRNSIRNVEIRRTYKLIEDITKDLEKTEELFSIRDNDAYSDLNKKRDVMNRKVDIKSKLYGQLIKQAQHLAQVAGINVETHVNVDHQQLVIIRADGAKKKQVIELNEDNSTIE